LIGALRCRAVRRTSVILCLAVSGCFYDSSWGHETTAQKHNAEAARPSSFKAPTESSGLGAKKASRTFHIHVWATSQFASQTLDWKRDFKEMLATANDILTASADTRLEIASIESWPSPPAQDDLGTALSALQKHDAGSDVEWVVGLVGSFPKFTTSFHDLGLAQLLGKHVALRAAGDVNEHEGAEAAFNKLSADERLAVVGERKRHRSVATFVHEIGHSLGAVHDETKDGLMHPFYSKSMRSFGTDVSKALAIGAAHRLDATHRAWAEELLGFYDKNESTWAAKERASMITNLKSYLGPAPAPVASAPPQFAEVPKELDAKDRPAWTRAVDAYRAAKMKDAWDAASPLFDAYPKVLAVQDLRCQIAMKIGFDWSRTKVECEKLMHLSTGK